MINVFTSRSHLNRLRLMSIILLCSVFTSENVLSLSWKKATKDVSFVKKDQTINFLLYSYYHSTQENTVYNYLNELNLEYSEDGKVFTQLLSTEMDFPESEYMIWARVKSMKDDEIIRFPNCDLRSKQSAQWIRMDILKVNYLEDNGKWVYTRYALLEVKWILPKSIKSIKAFRYTGKWNKMEHEKQKTETFREVMRINFVRPSSKSLKESNNNMKVIGTYNQ